MSIQMFVVAIFVMAGEPKIVQLETPSVTTCVSDIRTVESVLTSLGAQIASTFCVVEVTR